MKRLWIILFFCAAIAGFRSIDLARAANASQARKIDFNRDIRPILADKCLACHGPDAPNRRIRLRLDSEAGTRVDLGGGRRAIVPGEPARSELVHRITAADEAMRMPPASSGRSLSRAEIELLNDWVRQGGAFQTHWAFVPPVQPPLPAVRDRAWPKNAIDHFVLARLEREGLRPAPAADRATLLRRVSLDLTGLPPAPAELDAFLRDRSQNAYEKAVDRLLASPRYGERMAFRWLDAARYADTNGYQIDGERSMWRWRDWVINAFNRNLPFDQFVVEQLAGDLLPHPTLDQRIATAFNRNHRTNAEDGIVPEEYAVEYIVDRVDTTSTVFLGLTMGCARCHNHKFDPFTQKEYYQLYAYFNSIPEDGRASNYGNSAPWIAAPTREQQRAYDRLRVEIARTEREIDRHVGRNAAARRQWERGLDPAKNTQWFPGENLLVHHSLDAGAELEVRSTIPKIDPAKPEDEPEFRRPEEKIVVGFKDGAPRDVAAPTGQGAAFDGRLYFDAGKTADFNFRDRLRDYKDQFTLSAWFYPESEQAGAIVTHMRDNPDVKENNLPKGRGYGLFFNNGKLHFNLTSVWADDSYRVETERPLPINQWHHVVAMFDSTEPLEKARVYINGERQPLKINNGRLFRTFGDTSANLRIGGGAGPEWRFKGRIDEVRVYKSLMDEDQIAVLSCPDSLEAIASIPPRARTRAQRLKIRNAWLETASPDEARTAWGRAIILRAQRTRYEAQFSTIMVMEEPAQPRPAFLLRRGAYDAPGDRVDRGLPAILPAPGDPPKDRLGLARWIVGRENPLTARVTVNRFWQMLFGAGLVRTVEDFGTQGELPSHPELLDWLAVAFRDGTMNGMMKDERGMMNGGGSIHHSSFRIHRWDIKAMLKTIVTSAAYRQSSLVAGPAADADPENRLLTRGPRIRLPAEMIRDQALFASGLLVERLGGPSVKPYQPPGLWKDMTFSNMTVYHQEKGEGLWRRSLYTYWKRTVLAPGMFVFDASAREFCTVREARTNTPLQALNLMNDVTYLEAARMLAERMLCEGGATPEARIDWAFRLVVSRAPRDAERRILLDHLRAQRDYFRAHPKAVEEFLSVGEKRNAAGLDTIELAAGASTASLILNLDEAITKQ
ncbi:MAG: DUF1553 domain-containing protein [Blastocatellia bacterium]